MDNAWLLLAASVVALSLSGWIQPASPPCFLMHEWTGAEVLAELGELNRDQVEQLFEADMSRSGHGDWKHKLPPASAAHYLPVTALCSQMGLAFMYSWLVDQFAPVHVPCHDSFTHTVAISTESVQHTLRYRLKASTPNYHDGPPWRVQFVVRFCPHRQAILHAKVVAAPW